MKATSWQAQAYYPYGGRFDQYQSTASTANNSLFNQGTGDKTFRTERILELQIDMTKRRVYDYRAPHWWQIYPLADQGSQESWSPYHYSFNNPILYNDPFGEIGNNPVSGIGGDILQGFRNRIGAFNRRVESAVNTAKKGLNRAVDYVSETIENY